MIRSLVLGLVGIGATLGGGWFASREEAQTIVEATGGTEIVKIETVAVPVFTEGMVGGYALFRVALEVSSKKLKSLALPIGPAVTDALHSIVFGDARFDFAAPEAVDIDAMRDVLKAELTERLGIPVATVLIEQVDYLAKAEIRNRNLGSTGE